MIRDSRLRIIVLGYIVRGPLAGLASHYLQYVLALTRLGHEVYFFEDSDDYAAVPVVGHGRAWPSRALGVLRRA